MLPPGWKAGDASRLSYGQAVLTKDAPAGQASPTDTLILMGRLDLKLFAGAEPDNAKAAARLASDMGEFYMPFPGTRINQETIPLDAAGVPGTASFYEVKFTDATKPNGQIWAAAVGNSTPRVGTADPQNNRWFVVWLGSANNPVDLAAAKALAESIRPFTPPPPSAPGAPPGAPLPPGTPPPPVDPNAPPPPPADPNAPPPPPADPNAPPPPAAVGVPRPVNPADAPGMLPP